MNERIAILRQAITVVTQTLSGVNVQVTQAGLEAFVRSDATGKPVQVNLPYLPDNADEALIDAIQGFLDHEVAHILFTDFTKSMKIGDKATHQLFNILEDARIEKEMANKYRGCGLNLNNTAEFFLENMIEPELKKAVSKGASEEEMVGVLATPLLRAMSGQQRFQEYMKDKMGHVENFFEKIKDLQPKIESLRSTQDTIDMAKTIIKRIKDEPPEPDEEENEDEDEDGEMKMPSPKGAGGTGGKGGKDGEESEDESEEEGEGESEEESKAKDGSDGDKDSDEGEGEGKGESKPKSEKGDKKPSKGKKDTQPKGEVSNLDCKAILGEIDKNTANNYDSSISRKMGEQAAVAAKGSKYLVYTQDNDRVETLKVGSGFRPSMVTDMSDKVDSMVGPISKDLERAMRAKSLASWESGLRKGKLNSSALSRLSMGDDRVFRKKHQNITNDVAVSLVVDASGSMSGGKIHTAAASAYALSSVLDRLKISHEVICFTTGSIENGAEMQAQERKYGIKYSRYESLYMPIVKGFDERVDTEIRKRFAWLPNVSFLRNNIDGECVDIAHRRLRMRKEKGKIMIVLSDGCPAGHSGTGHGSLSKHLKDVVEGIERSGTKVIGIGINSSEVTKFYKKSVVVKDVSELPKGVITELRTMLMAK